MKKMHHDLFKNLVKAYYDGSFDEYLTSLINKNEYTKDELLSIVSSLCGVNLLDTDNYIQNLKEAIKNYNVDHKIVEKVKNCTMECTDKSGKTICQKSCPFDAIYINKDKKTTYINNDKCTDCGFCVESCPNGSLLDKVEFLPLVELLKSKQPVVAAVAPAISGQFGSNTNLNKLRTAFKKIGFVDMVEVAFFADMLTLKESVEFNEFVKNKNDLMITSCCCPMWVAMLKRVYSNLVKYVSPSVSPMIAAGRVLKELNSNCKVVFIGPCIAKKAEAKEKDLLGDIDYVLTFAEVKDIFEALNIDVEKLEENESYEYASRGGKLYARTGGVSIAVSEAVGRLFPEKYKLLTAVQANGVRECKEILSKAQNKEIEANFVEGMGCVGGCVGGPKAIISKDKGTEFVNEVADSAPIKVAIDSQCMHEILNKIGIESIKDFENEEKRSIFERNF